MADGNEKTDGQPTTAFGSCCSELKEAMEGEDFEPLITVGSDGVLYMAVGLIPCSSARSAERSSRPPRMLRPRSKRAAPRKTGLNNDVRRRPVSPRPVKD